MRAMTRRAARGRRPSTTPPAASRSRTSTPATSGRSSAGGTSGALAPTSRSVASTSCGWSTARSSRPPATRRPHRQSPPWRADTFMGDPMTTVNVNEVALGIESFGDHDAPLVLLASGTTMLSWPDPLCERLAAGGRRVVRYDLRDSGASTTADPEAPASTLRDLAADAAALAVGLSGGPAQLAGIGVGGMVAQVAALDHPGTFSAITLAGTRAVAPGKPDADLPDHDKATMKRLFTRPMPDWTDREAVAEFAAAGTKILGDDPVAARATAGRIWDRTPDTAPPVQMANQLGMVFSKLNCKPRWRERLPEIGLLPLTVHGRRDPFFPLGNGESIAREVPGARLLILQEAATAIPDAAAGEVAEAMLALG